MLAHLCHHWTGEDTGLSANVCPHDVGGEHLPVSLGWGERPSGWSPCCLLRGEGPSGWSPCCLLRGEGPSGWWSPCCLVGGEGPSGWASPCCLLRAPRVFRPREHAGTMLPWGSATGRRTAPPGSDPGHCEGTDAAAFGSRVTSSYLFGCAGL